MPAQGAAPEGRTSGQRLIDGDTTDTNCIGCGLPTADAERVCPDCRHTDSKHGTLVTGSGRPCPWCEE